MDSTISVQPGEAPDSLHRARRAARVVLPARWSTGTIFSLWHYRRAGVQPRIFPANRPGDGNACRLCHLRRWVSFSPARRNYFWPLRRSPRAETDADDDRLDDGYRHCLHRPAPSFNQIGWWAPVLLVFLRAVQGFAVGGEWGGAALLSVENAPQEKAFTAVGCRWATASASCSLPGWYR